MRKNKAFSTILVFILALTMIFNINITKVFAQDQILMALEAPLNNANVSNVLKVSGWAIGMSSVQKIDVYVDSKFVGQATYGLVRDDVYSGYPTYPNSKNSGFSFDLNTKKFINGDHQLNVIGYLADGTTTSKQATLHFNNQFTSILGQAQVQKGQMIQYFLNNNDVKGYAYIDNFVSILLEEASIEGIRADVAFAQMMKETNYLKFTGVVQEGQNNFAGLGATGGSVTGESFPDIRTGIRAVIQHLKAYATTTPLVQACVDTRYKYVTKGSSPFVEWLGIPDNPYGVGWASDSGYGYDIINRVNVMKTLGNAPVPAKASSLSLETTLILGKSYYIFGAGNSENGVLYQFWVRDLSTGMWSLLQDYSSKNSYIFTPTKAGLYRIEMHVKDAKSSSYFDDNLFTDVVVQQPGAKISDFSLGNSFNIYNTYSISSTATSPNKALYQYWIKDYSSGQWSLLQDYSENSKCSFTPMKIGTYRIEVHVKDINGKYEYDDYAFKDVTVAQTGAKVGQLNVNSVMNVNSSYTISGSGSSSNKTLYQFWKRDLSTGAWELLQDYSENSTYVFTPNKTGQFRIEMHVKDSSSTNYFDDFKFADITVKDITAKFTSFSVETTMKPNSSYPISATATSGNKVLYQFWVRNLSTGLWTLLKDYSETNTFNYVPTTPGNYRIEVHVKDINSTNYFDDFIFSDVIVFKPGAKAVSLNTTTMMKLKNTYTISGTASSSTKVLYQFWLRDYSTGAWSLLQDYSENNSCTFTPQKLGTYKVEMHVKNIDSTNIFDDNLYTDIGVIPNDGLTLLGKKIVVDAGHNYGGDDGAYSTFGSTQYCERDLNMLLALKLRAELEKLGATVIFTRETSDTSTTDVKTSLQRRVDIANNSNADLFISLHHDSNDNPNVSGVSVHYSTYKPGIDNSGIVIGNDPYGWYTGVNIDTTPSKQAIMSRDLAYRLADRLSSSLGYINKNAHDHNLFVTVNTNMPAVLIENGYISNQTEAQRSADPDQQTLKSQVIAKVVSDYFSTLN